MSREKGVILCWNNGLPFPEPSGEMMVQVDMETSIHMVTGHEGAFIATPMKKTRLIKRL
jgi:hypothetical protein